MNEFNFKSAICTSVEQSRRLLELGLKQETADMAIEPDLESTYEVYYISAYPPSKRGIPAWSLHRLIEIVAHTQYPYYVISKELSIYDAICERIEWLIKEGYFNKEYLNGED